MGFFELLAIGVALSMDAFAVSVGKGLSVRSLKLKQCLSCGIWFGGFQALMPLLGFLLAGNFAKYIERFDHWIAFGLLALIGANMIREALSDEEEGANDSFAFKTMLVLALATSIDALVAGVSLSLAGANIWVAISIIGVTTFLFSSIGVKVGNVFGSKYQSKAEFVGGAILILMGIKILVEHLCE